MAKRGVTEKGDETFGTRLREFRNAKGLTQLALGHKVGLSQRMVAYYEIQGGTPGPALLAKLASALGVTTDALVGRTTRKTTAEVSKEHVRIWRRFRRLTELPPHDRKAILKMIDAMTEHASRRKAS